MILRKLSILNFKNIPQAEEEFSPGINALVGSNGAGKTNVLDAIYYLSMCKSSLVVSDSQCITHGADFFMLEGGYLTDSGRTENISCSFRRGGGKSIRRAGKEYERLSDHIGNIPAVIVSPADIYLVSDSAEERRRWLNSFISQLDRQYLASLIRYNRVLSERNRLLKQLGFAANRELLEVLDEQIAPRSDEIHARRAALAEKLRPLTAGYYRILSGDREQVELEYRSELNESPMADLLARSRQRDIINQYTTAGIHRDDLVMRIGGHPLRKYGSQGQQKSFLIALKLAQHAILTEQSGERPVLLLDDLFDKLDASRLERLLSLVGTERFGQIFISDCNSQRLLSVLEGSEVGFRLFDIEDGRIVKKEDGETR